MNRSLKVNETFLSLQGESTHAGRLCSFIRLTGCPLRCTYCDTAYAFHEGSTRTFEEVFKILETYGANLVEVTGGEPLAQKQCIPLLRELVAKGYEVLLETSGAFPVFEVPKEVAIILDVKTPGSGEMQRNFWDNMGAIKPGLDEVKFVLTSREDFDFACDVTRRYALLEKHAVLLSPSHQKLEPHTLAQWIINSKLPFRMQLQMHKYIWGAETRGV